MAEPARLQQAATSIADEADRLSALFARQLGRVLRDLDRSLRNWLADAPKPTMRNRAQIRRIVAGAGYDQLAVAATGEPFDAVASRIVQARTVGGLAVAESEAAAARLNALRQWHLSDLLDEGSVLARSLGDVVMRSGGRAARRLPADVAKALDQAEGRIQTLYDTAVSVFGRQVEAEQAGDDPATRFVFMGPVDAKTRDFCLEHVGRVYTREAIDALDNGQISNVFLTGGGYNCRHVWQEISKFSELYDTGEAPEIRDAVAALEKAA